ncbi:MAG: AAA family ATPase [Acidimicrobiia bacterium]|nr:AAA family ATPase [Acidimicrobiia bacterium]
MDRIAVYETNEQFEPTVAGAAWQYRWLVLLLAIGFAGLGWLYGSSNEAYTATASIGVEDPRISNLFTVGYDATPERYVRSQAEIVASRVVAARAAEIAAQADPPVTADVDYIMEEGLAVDASTDSDLISITYSATTAYEAITMANAIATAYQEVGREAAAAEFEAAVLELDSSITALTSQLLDVEQSLRDLQSSDASRLALEAQLDTALSRLLLFEPSSSSASLEDLADTAARLNEIRLEIETLQAALAREDTDLDTQSLIDQRDDLRQRLTDLQLVRDQREVDAQLSTSGVVFSDPAATAEPSSIGVMVLAGFMLGGIIGSAIAFPLSRGKRRFGSRSEPERALGSPLISDVPNFLDERLSTNLPVVEAPGSVSAEAFRFVSTAIAVQRDRAGAGMPAFRTVVVTSALIATGKTTAVANTAFAAALGGNRVLVVDADFTSQELTRILIGSVAPRHGLADLIEGETSLEEATVSVNMEGAGSVDLLSSGTPDLAAADLLSLPAVADVFREWGERYDLILVDAPPILSVAYSTSLIRLADRVIVVTSHGHDYSSTQDLRYQLDMIGTPQLGYIYNFAPLRAEMTLVAGSMADWNQTPAAGPESETSPAEK